MRQRAYLAVVALTGLGAAAFWAATPPRPQVSRPPMEVEFGGCSGVEVAPVCLIDGGRITLWVDAVPGTFLVELDGAPPPGLETASVQGGVRLSFEVPSGDHRVEVLPGQGVDRSSWTLGFTSAGVPTWAQEVRALIRTGDLAAAVRLLSDLEPQKASTGLALATQGQLALSQGQTELGESLLEEALPGLRAAADVQLETRFAALLVHSYLTATGRFADARQLLDTFSESPHLSLETQFHQAYFRGVLASMSGDARTALVELKAAVTHAERLGDPRQHRLSVQMLAIQLQSSGRREEARRLLEWLLEDVGSQPTSCEGVLLLNNLAWNRLLSLEAGESVANPAPLLVQILEQLAENCPGQTHERLNVLLNLALARLHDQDLQGARSALQDAADENDEPGLQFLLWKRELDARLALEAGQPSAAAEIYREITQLAELAWSPEAAWRAAVGLGRAFRASGDFEAALGAFRDSERQLDEALLAIPLQQGREALVAYCATATKQHLDLLMETGRVDEAFDLARTSRTRLSRQLRQSIRHRRLDPSQRQRWYAFVAEYRAEREWLERASAASWEWAAQEVEAEQRKRRERRDQLSRRLDRLMTDIKGAESQPLGELDLAEDELALLFHPLPVGWAVFSKTGDDLAVSRIDCSAEGSARQTAVCLLDSQRELLGKAGRLRILASGALASVDFHTLAVNSTLSVSTLPVTYDLDLGGGTDQPPNRRRRILILSDPTEDLPAARTEGATVERLLAKHAQVEVLAGAQAKVSSLRAALGRASGFHLAGHATFRGRDGWESYIPLAEDSQFAIEDILALERVPEWVVLSGCNTARGSQHGEGLESIGLAQAFLAAGSRVVVAAVRPVEDQAAAELTEAFYRLWFAGLDSAVALHRAQKQLRQQNPTTDWDSYRLIRG